MEWNNIKGILLLIAVNLIGIGVLFNVKWGFIIEFIFGCIIIILLALMNIKVMYELIKEKKSHLCAS